MAHQWQVMLFFLSRLCTIGKEAGITAVIQPGGSIKTSSIIATKINLQWYLQEPVILNINLFNFVGTYFLTFKPLKTWDFLIS
jgi:hypothetical protein